jgi:hypothetical protein
VLAQLCALQHSGTPPFVQPGGSVPRQSSGVLVARSWEVGGGAAHAVCGAGLAALLTVTPAFSAPQELQHFLFLDSWDDRIGKHRLRYAACMSARCSRARCSHAAVHLSLACPLPPGTFSAA